MSTDQEKDRISKLLADLEVPEIKVTQRCSDLVKEFHRKYDGAIEHEEEDVIIDETYENPYTVDQEALKAIDKQLKALLGQHKQSSKEPVGVSPSSSDTDDKRSRCTSSGQEQVLCVDNELKNHHKKGSQSITPLPEEQMQALIKECMERNTKFPPVSGVRLKEVVEQAKKALPQFQYRKNIENSTAIVLLSTDSPRLPE